MSAPATASAVAQKLGELAKELDLTVRQLEVADRDATEKRAAADLAYSRAFLEASGSVDARKHHASIDTHQQRLDADVAETMVRHLRRRIDAIKVRIDVGRSYGAAVRAETALVGHMGET